MKTLEAFKASPRTGGSVAAFLVFLAVIANLSTHMELRAVLSVALGIPAVLLAVGGAVYLCRRYPALPLVFVAICFGMIVATQMLVWYVATVTSFTSESITLCRSGVVLSVVAVLIVAIYVALAHRTDRYQTLERTLVFLFVMMAGNFVMLLVSVVCAAGHFPLR